MDPQHKPTFTERNFQRARSMKKNRVILSEDAREVYNYLKENAPNAKTERALFKAVTNKIELLKSNIHYGQSIAKQKIPQAYIEKYEINNLFRVELPHYWRMLYTITNEGKVEILVFILYLIDHSTYNKKFGYKPK